ATLMLIERMLKKLDLNPLMRLIGVSAVAFSYAFWQFSVDAEVHIPGVFFTIAGLYLLVFRQTKPGPLIGAAFCFAAAAGFHLTNMLIAATVFLYLLYKRAPWRRFAQFSLAYLTFMALFYGVFSALSHKPVLTILYNVFFGPNIYSGYSSNSFNPVTLPTIVSSLASLKHALVAEAGIWAWIVCAGFLALLAMAFKPANTSTKKGFRQAMVFWFIPFFIFFTFWDTANIEFKIHVLLPLLLIAIAALARLKPIVAQVVGVFLSGCLLLVNLLFGIKPQTNFDKNINYQVALAIQKATPENAQIMIAGNFYGYGYGKIYIPYFARREVIILDWILGKGRSLPEIYILLKKISGSGQPIYALAEIAEPGIAVNHLLNFHHIQESAYSGFRSGIQFIPAAKLPGGYLLYRLEIKSP
ncbi:MAG: DUF2723 domain-containing protein, partial [Candidatus Aminicenantes bacterium]|nr:DUF2723 domain-containing protein [Candidatus Aminicenantes bacterium]